MYPEDSSKIAEASAVTVAPRDLPNICLIVDNKQIKMS